MDLEIKYIEGYEGEYAIINDGSIYSYKSNKFLTPRDNGCGYQRVLLDGVGYSVHRLVAEAFLPNPDNLEVVDHINELKIDNRVENLQWISRTNNTKNIMMDIININLNKLMYKI